LTTIICLGNAMRGDDGAAPAVAERLRAGGVPVIVEQPANLIDAWTGAHNVVVVDTVCSGAAVGTVHRIDAARGSLPVGMGSPSTHGLGLADAVELARILGRLPRCLSIFGIEGSAFGYGEALSEEVERAVELVAEELVGLVRM
jgi:hydrogenase maturation protease